VEYTVTLKKTMAIDFRETEGRRGRDDAERVWCVPRSPSPPALRSRSQCMAKPDEGCGSRPIRTTARLQRMCQGTATPQKWPRFGMDTPGAGAGSPNGQPISDVFSKVKFFAGNQARLRGGNHPPDPKLDPSRLTSPMSFQDRMNSIYLCL
jgi:hypothetical protein